MHSDLVALSVVQGRAAPDVWLAAAQVPQCSFPIKNTSPKAILPNPYINAATLVVLRSRTVAVESLFRGDVSLSRPDARL